MTKEQFIMELEQCLQGEVSAYELSDSLTYYRQYFEDEIRNGKSEEQVVEELGSPRLIARSIIDAHGIEESASGNSDYGDNSYGSGYAQNDSSYRSYGDAYSDRRDIENIFHCIIFIAGIVAACSDNYCSSFDCTPDSRIIFKNS